MNALEVMKERGFLKQCSDEDELAKIMAKQKIPFYAGFDPTADSLHIGSLVPIMAMAHLQQAGHTPIVLIGGGTTLIGDPSGKTTDRRLMSREEITSNGEKIREQFTRYLQLGSEQGMFVNNADWLCSLNYIEFLRDIGKYFRVNEMLRAESNRRRLEREEGLSFIEFNYQLLQAYDFLVLFDQYGCCLQIGGDDQWSNILAGSDLIRRMRSAPAFGLTLPLISTATGGKMGKTESGAIWLDVGRTSPYDFYQYWINCDDRDVVRWLAMFTFLPMTEVDQLAQLQGADIRQAKKVLAYETTKLAHGQAEADKATTTSLALFTEQGGGATEQPDLVITRQNFGDGINIVDLLVTVGLASSKSEAHRLIKQGGAYVNNRAVASSETMVTAQDIKDHHIQLRKGKKQQRSVRIE